ncbi:CBS domain-containing protein [Polaribacter tangerinus]|uniref:CBS domain-containing protein n=1 Tax=Polaribacter tangerinus TaxID=1920034 RepID=UPI000B4B924C|nr:CBS domain-containing protein [Polaribacter tangerinus]
MEITAQILNEIKPLKQSNSLEDAKELFANYPITHFPMVENHRFLGCFAEQDIQTLEESNSLITNYNHLLNVFFTDEKASILEVLKIFADNDTNILPVLDATKNYKGYYDLNDILDLFATSPFLAENSETILVEKLETDFSMSEIAQIIESNNSKVLGIYVSEKKENTVQITIKTITKDVQEIVHSFRRYDYKIISSHEDDVYLEDLKNRSQYLQKYLEM